MTTILANFPWWLTAALILGGAVMLVNGNRGNKPSIRSIGLAIVSLAFLLGAARFLIDTPAEKCEKRTRQIVECADRGDWAQMQSLMNVDSYVDLNGADKQLSGLAGKSVVKEPEVAKTAALLAQNVKLKQVKVYQLSTEQIRDQVKITITAATQFSDSGDQWFSSVWEFDYQLTGNTQDLQTIKLLQLQGQNL